MKQKGMKKNVSKAFVKLLFMFTVFILLGGLFTSFVSAQVVVVSKATSNIYFNKNMLSIEKEITLKNTADSMIIPGEIHFRLYQIKDDDSKVKSQITNLKAFDSNKEIDVKLVEKKNEVEIVVTIWEPLPPKYENSIKITYDLLFDEKGIFFHSIDIPEEQMTIPVIMSETNLIFPKSFFISYAPDSKITSLDDKKIVSWKGNKFKSIEYTKLPMPKTNIHGATIFWIGLIVVLLIPLIFFFIKEFLGKRK